MEDIDAQRKIINLATELKETGIESLLWVSKMLSIIVVVMQLKQENADFFFKMDAALEETRDNILLRNLNK